MYTTEMALGDMTLLYIPTMTIMSSGMQVILSFYLKMLRSCSISITNGKDL
jgi:putative effector of murein hydrolase LrgA (UPF0299 family)